MLIKPRLASCSGRVKDRRDPQILNEEEVFSIGSLNNYEGDGNEDGKKAIGLGSKTTTLHVHHAFCTFLCRRCTTTTWKCLISRFDANFKQHHSCTRCFAQVLSKTTFHGFPHVFDLRSQFTTFFFFSWTLIQSFRIQLPKKIANIWRI